MLTVSAHEVAAELRLVVTRLARRLRQEAGAGLSPSLTAALATVDRLGPLTPSALADAERVRRPTATRIIAQLEADGLIEREPHPTDGRVVSLRSTRDGHALLEEMRGRKTAYLAERLAGLEPAQLAVLHEASAILDELLEERP